MRFFFGYGSESRRRLHRLGYGRRGDGNRGGRKDNGYACGTDKDGGGLRRRRRRPARKRCWRRRRGRWRAVASPLVAGVLPGRLAGLDDYAALQELSVLREGSDITTLTQEAEESATAVRIVVALPGAIPPVAVIGYAGFRERPEFAVCAGVIWPRRPIGRPRLVAAGSLARGILWVSEASLRANGSVSKSKESGEIDLGVVPKGTIPLLPTVGVGHAGAAGRRGYCSSG